MNFFFYFSDVSSQLIQLVEVHSGQFPNLKF
jgi:hypothetical protein